MHAQSEISTLSDPRTPCSRSELAPSLRALFADGRALDEPARLLRPGVTEIGRSPAGGGIVLDDPRVSRRHARVEVDPRSRRVALSRVGDSRVAVEGRAVEEAVLRDGQLVSLAGALLLFRQDPAVGAGARAPGFIGNAPAARRAQSLIEMLAPTSAVVLLLGETGVGKEVAARALHEASGRAGPFVAVNCGAIPDGLAETQVFGHVRGAFTGAREAAVGLFRAASGGTLFLDEIGELSPVTQSRLLRAVESGRVVPVGASAEVAYDARIVAATHRDLVEDVEHGRFRRDLFARISDFVIELPALRERREDVLLLLRHAYGPELPPLRPSLAQALVLHSWPFNVREVVQVAAYMRIMASGAPVLSLSMVSDLLARSTRLSSIPSEPTLSGPPDREELVALLRRHGGAVPRVADEVGRSRRQVYRWMAQLGVDPRTVLEEEQRGMRSRLADRSGPPE